MLSSIMIPIVALLAYGGAAQLDLGKIAAESPVCSTQCTVTNLAIAQCQLTNITNCLCTNTTLLYDLSVCVLETCNLTEQASAANILQDVLCAGVPEPSRSADIIRATIIMSVFTYIVFILRCISRYMVAQKLWWDDWALLSGVLVTIPMSAIPIYNAYMGFGKHFWDVPSENLKNLRLLFWVSQILYCYGQPISKISILLLYLRIFPNKAFRICVVISIAWMVCHTIGFALWVVFQCLPVYRVWDLAAGGKCSSLEASAYAGAGLVIFEDLVIITLPVFVLKGLSLTTRKKIALCLLFALGSFACITSMVRLRYIVYIAHSIDTTWDAADLIIWSIIETYTAIICASLVSLRPLIAKLIPAIFPTTAGSTDNKKRVTTDKHNWSFNISSRLSTKLRSSRGAELFSEDELSLDQNGKVVNQKASVRMKASAVGNGSDIELGEKWLPFGNAHLELKPQHKPV